MDKKTIRNVIIFIVAVIISGWIGVLVDSALTRQPKGDSLGMEIWFILPILIAIIIIRYLKGSWKDIGLKPNFRGNMRWYLASTLIFPVVTGIVLLIGATPIKWIELSAFNLKPFISAFGSTLLIYFIKNIFEKTTWRPITKQTSKTKKNEYKEDADLRILYQITAEEIRSVKNQQWQTTNYGLLLQAGLIGLFYQLKNATTISNEIKVSFSILSFILAIAGTLRLVNYQRNLIKYRDLIGFKVIPYLSDLTRESIEDPQKTLFYEWFTNSWFYNDVYRYLESFLILFISCLWVSFSLVLWIINGYNLNIFNILCYDKLPLIWKHIVIGVVGLVFMIVYLVCSKIVREYLTNRIKYIK